MAVVMKELMKVTYTGNTKTTLHVCDAKRVHNMYEPGSFQLALFSTPYPKTRGFEMSVNDYLGKWLPPILHSIIAVMSPNGVIMQNVWFPRTDQGWYDERIFLVPALYCALGFHMIDPHPWDKKNTPPSGNHTRYDHNGFEFCFTFAGGTEYTYNKYRSPYADKTKTKAASGNMRQQDAAGHHAGGHAQLNPEGAAQSNIYRFSPTGGQEVYRPRTPDGVFPMALAERAILQYSNPKDTVLDPFCGTGTTLIESARNGRHSVGFDTNADNIKIADEWLREEVYNVT